MFCSFLQLILDILAQIVCIRITKCCQKVKSVRELPLQANIQEKEHLESRDHDIVISRDLFEDLRVNGSQGSGLYVLEKRLRSMHTMISDVIKKQNDKEDRERHYEKIEVQWRNLALVLDRLFFIIYLIGILISLSVLFPRSSPGY